MTLERFIYSCMVAEADLLLGILTAVSLGWWAR